MKDPFKKIVEELGLKVNVTLVEDQLAAICERIVLDCVELIDAHACNMETYKFLDKAKTAHVCAGILLEHFEMKEHNDTSI